MTTFMSRSEADRWKRDDSRTAITLAMAFSPFPMLWSVTRTSKSGVRAPVETIQPEPVFLIVIDNEQIGQATTAAQTVVPTARYQFVSPISEDIQLGDRLISLEDPSIKFSITTVRKNDEIREGDLAVAR